MRVDESNTGLVQGSLPLLLLHLLEAGIKRETHSNFMSCGAVVADGSKWLSTSFLCFLSVLNLAKKPLPDLILLM